LEIDVPPETSEIQESNHGQRPVAAESLMTPVNAPPSLAALHRHANFLALSLLPIICPAAYAALQHYASIVK
jgi:hypothetical protein